MSDNATVAATEENTESNAETNETNETNEAASQPATANAAPETVQNPEDVSYHTVEKEGTVSAIWEMQGRKHIRTIDPRSQEGKQILELFETAA